MDYDKTNIPETYNQGRDHGPAVRQLWMDAIDRSVDRELVGHIREQVILVAGVLRLLELREHSLDFAVLRFE